MRWFSKQPKRDPNDSGVNLNSDNFFILEVGEGGNTNKSLIVNLAVLEGVKPLSMFGIN